MSRIINELVFIRWSEPEISYRIEQHPLPVNASPEDHAEAITFTGHATNPSLPHAHHLHKSSWRYIRKQDIVILTWLVMPDPYLNHSSRIIPTDVNSTTQTDEIVLNCLRNFALTTGSPQGSDYLASEPELAVSISTLLHP